MRAIQVVLLCGVLAAPRTAFSEGSHAAEAFFTLLTVGMTGMRHTQPDEFPGVVHLLQQENANEMSSCGGVIVGACVITAAHCVNQKAVSLTAVTPSHKKYKADLKGALLRGIPTLKNGREATDLAIVKLDSTPEEGYGEEILDLDGDYSRADEALKAKSFDEVVENAPTVTVVGYGRTSDDEAMDQAIKSLAPDSVLMAHVGVAYRNFLDNQRAHQQVGTVALLGDAKHALYTPELLELQRRWEGYELANQHPSFFKPGDLERVQKNLQAQQQRLDSSKSYAMLPRPTKLWPGDSGSPVFSTKDGKLRLIAVNASIEEPVNGEGWFVEFSHRHGMFSTPLAANREWVKKAMSDLKCFEPTPQTEAPLAMPAAKPAAKPAQKLTLEEILKMPGHWPAAMEEAQEKACLEIGTKDLPADYPTRESIATYCKCSAHVLSITFETDGFPASAVKQFGGEGKAPLIGVCLN